MSSRYEKDRTSPAARQQASERELEEYRKTLRSRYRNLLNSTEEKAKPPKPRFLKELHKNIKSRRPNHAKTQLSILETDTKKREVLKCQNANELNTLQLAVLYSEDNELITELVRLCPSMIQEQRTDEYLGQTVLHILIVKKNIKAMETILKTAQSEKLRLLNGEATGRRFEFTVMMGELPISVASLTFSLDVVDLLREHDAFLSAQNSHGDTVFHTLVRFAACYPEKLEKVKDMMLKLHHRLGDEYKKQLAYSEFHTESEDTEKETAKMYAREVWLLENEDGLTALRLAATLSQPELFRLILNLEGVYHHLDHNDGLFDCLLFDVTEIDPVALSCAHISRLARLENRKESNIIIQEHKKILSAASIRRLVKHKSMDKEDLRQVSVLEILCETPQRKRKPEDRTVLGTDVVKEMIKLKWKHYQYWFWSWAILHVLFMVTLTAHGVYKAGLIKYDFLSKRPNTVERAFVTAVAILTLAVPLVILPLELLVMFRQKQPWKLRLHHHNGLYRVMLIVFSISVAADSIWFLSAGADNNYFLTLALLVGWWFTTFFLRPFKMFSFFTVMLQKIFFGDLLRFFIIIILEWMAFSVTMHMNYLATPDEELPPGFEDLWKSMLTMFQLLVGMADINVLHESRNAWLAVTLYVAYVILTYVMMMNALIAMMSSTCALISSERDDHWELQQLSVVLLLESLIPYASFRHNCGHKEEVYRFDLFRKQHYPDHRFFMKVITALDDEADSTPTNSPEQQQSQTSNSQDQETPSQVLGTSAKKQVGRQEQPEQPPNIQESCDRVSELENEHPTQMTQAEDTSPRKTSGKKNRKRQKMGHRSDNDESTTLPGMSPDSEMLSRSLSEEVSGRKKPRDPPLSTSLSVDSGKRKQARQRHTTVMSPDMQPDVYTISPANYELRLAPQTPHASETAVSDEAK